jgi:predicted negative regulator of RcsB-dependent stress response
MAAQSLASRSGRPARAPDSEDAVIARALEFSQWAQRNARILVIATILGILLIGGTIYYRSYQAERAERAAADFMALEQTAAAAPDPTLVAADLERFASRYDGTAYADEARVLLARIRLEEGQIEQAIPPLEAAARRMGRTGIGGQAGLLLAAAHEQAGNLEAADATYLRVSREARFDFERQQALEAAAMLRQTAGNYAGAAELYRQLAAEAEAGSMERSIFEMRLAEAEQQALAQQQ